MKNKGVFCLAQRRLRVVSGTMALVFLLSLTFYVIEAQSTGIPPEVEKKSVSMEKDNADAERSFNSKCSKCHNVPDAASSKPISSGCSKDLTKDELVKMKNYMADVRTGKGLYESYCGRCHTLIDPGAHTFDYWSKNICTSDSCMVDRKLTKEEEQKILLYLSSHAERAQ